MKRHFFIVFCFLFFIDPGAGLICDDGCGLGAYINGDNCSTAPCAICPSNEWCDGFNKHACTTQCATGEYIYTQCSTEADAACETCCSGEFCGTSNVWCDGVNKHTCTVCDEYAQNCTIEQDAECSATTTTTAAPTTTTPAPPVECSAGQYLAADEQCAECPPGKWCDGVNTNNCSTECPVGEYIHTQCSSTEDMVCARCCPENSFVSADTGCNTSADAECAACANITTCGAGNYFVETCDSVNDNVCSEGAGCSYGFEPSQFLGNVQENIITDPELLSRAFGDKYYSFSGPNTADAIDLGSMSMSGDFSFSFWAYRLINFASMRYVTFSNQFVVDQGGLGFRIVLRNGYTFVSGQQTTPLNTWVHLSASFSANPPEIRMYVDGELKETIALPGEWVGNNLSPSHIGSNPTSHTLHGYMADVLFYNRVMSAEEIANIYAGENAYCDDVLYPFGGANLDTKVGCPEGKWCDGVDATNCSTACPAGEYIHTQCTSASDIECAACPPGKWCNGVSAMDCTTYCGLSKYIKEECSASSQTVCAFCDNEEAWCDGVDKQNCTTQCAAHEIQGGFIDPAVFADPVKWNAKLRGSEYPVACIVVNGGAQCWGNDVNAAGLLGYDTTMRVYGDIDSYGEIDIGQGSEHIVDLTIGWRHACALLSSSQIRCWGINTNGALGTADGVEYRRWESERVGMPNVDLGEGIEVEKVRAGTDVTCIIVEFHRGVKCWGRNDLNGMGAQDGGNVGLAVGSMADLPYIDLGIDPADGDAVDIDVRFENVCVVIRSWGGQHVRCWGQNAFKVAYPSGGHYYAPAPPLYFEAGFAPEKVFVGWSHACVVDTAGLRAKCWGLIEKGGSVPVPANESLPDIWSNQDSKAIQVVAWNAGWGSVAGSVGSKIYLLCDNGVMEKLNDGGGVFVDANARAPTDGGIVGTAFIAGGADEYAFGTGAACLAYQSGRVECWSDAFHNGMGVEVPFNATNPTFLDIDAALNATFVDVRVREADIYSCRASQDLVCNACPDGYSCGGTFARKCSCGSNGVQEYYRIPGAVCNLTHADDVLCEVCPAGYWCIDDNKYQCGINAESPEGSNNITDCTCTASFFGPDGAQACTECPVNAFCPGGEHKHDCNPNAIAPQLSDGADDCVCRVGYETIATDANGVICDKCTNNEYCEGGEVIVECPDAQMILPDSLNSTTVDETLCYCRPGFVLQAGEFDTQTQTFSVACALCPENSFCLGGSHSEQCVEHSLSVPGSNHSGACVCLPGYYKDEAGACQTCPEDSWCFGSVLNACPDNANAPAQSSALADCSCLDGYGTPEGSSTLCEPCPAGSVHKQWDPSDACVVCGQNMETNEAQTQCSCLTGYDQSSENMPDEDGCDVCAFNYFGEVGVENSDHLVIEGTTAYAVVGGKAWVWGQTRDSRWWNWAEIWKFAFTAPDYPYFDNDSRNHWDNSNEPDGIVLEPTPIEEPSGIKKIASGQARLHCFFFENGKLRCWGETAYFGRFDKSTFLPGGMHYHFGEYKDVQWNTANDFIASDVLNNGFNMCALNMERTAVRCLIGPWADDPSDIPLLDSRTNWDDFGTNPGDIITRLHGQNYRPEICAVITPASGGRTRFFCKTSYQNSLNNDQHKLSWPQTGSHGRYLEEHLPEGWDIAQLDVARKVGCVVSTDGRVKCWGEIWGVFGGGVEGMPMGFDWRTYCADPVRTECEQPFLGWQVWDEVTKISYGAKLRLGLPDIVFPEGVKIKKVNVYGLLTHECGTQKRCDDKPTIALTTNSEIYMIDKYDVWKYDIEANFGPDLGPILDAKNVYKGEMCILFASGGVKCKGKTPWNGWYEDTDTAAYAGNIPYVALPFGPGAGEAPVASGCSWCKEGFMCTNSSIEACPTCANGQMVEEACTPDSPPACRQCDPAVECCDGIISVPHTPGQRCDNGTAVQCDQVGAYCPGDSYMYDCPTGSSTTEGLYASLVDCVCVPGYTGTSAGGGGCVVCPPDHYCPTNNVEDRVGCPEFSSSAKGSTLLENCTCDIGWEQEEL